MVAMVDYIITCIIEQSKANIMSYGFRGNMKHSCDAPCIIKHNYLILMYKM